MSAQRRMKLCLRMPSVYVGFLLIICACVDSSSALLPLPSLPPSIPPYFLFLYPRSLCSYFTRSRHLPRSSLNAELNSPSGPQLRRDRHAQRLDRLVHGLEALIARRRHSVRPRRHLGRHRARPRVPRVAPQQAPRREGLLDHPPRLCVRLPRRAVRARLHHRRRCVSPIHLAVLERVDR